MSVRNNPSIEPVRDLIEDYISLLTKSSVAINNLNIMPLTGGLSGASVILVSYGELRHVVKVDKKENVLKDISTYWSFIHDRAQILGNIALMVYPKKPVDYKKKGLANISILERTDYNGIHYSLHCYSFAGSPQGNVAFASFDKWIQSFIVQNKKSSMFDFRKVLDRLDKILVEIFAGEYGNIEMTLPEFALPAIPWSQFMPVAMAYSSYFPSWKEFCMELPTIWQECLSRQIPINVQYHLCHGDLRCANILIVQNKDINFIDACPFLIDFGLTGPEHPMYDYARLEVDIIQRILCQETEESYIATVDEILSWTCLSQPTLSDSSILLQIINEIRIKAQLQMNDIRDRTKLSRYELFLIGHATRMIRNDDPELRRLPNRHLFMWYILRLLHKAIKVCDPKRQIPNITLPVRIATISSLDKWGITNLFYGSEARGVLKRETIEKDDGPIRLLAHTGYSYLNSVIDRFYHSIVNRLSKKDGTKFEIILLNPYSIEGSKLGIAEARGLIQGPEVDCDYHEEHTTIFRRFKESLETYRRLRNRFDFIELRIIHYSPDATILLSKQRAFVEPYLVGNVYKRYFTDQQMNVPEFNVQENTALYELAVDQFTFFWNRAISVDEYMARMEEYRNEFMRFERLKRKVVALHESWFAVDAIVGCMNLCVYCFLTPYRINNKSPFIYRSPEDAIKRLFENESFRTQIQQLNSINWLDYRLPVPIAIGNYTDMFDSRTYPRFVESGYGNETNNLQELQNTVRVFCQKFSEATIIGKKYRRWPTLCLITKLLLPESFSTFLESMLRTYLNLRIAIFVSISFLPDGFEKIPIAQDKLLDNFSIINKVNAKIKDDRIKGIHFWRPLIPGINCDNMEEQLLKVKNAGAHSSVAVGLKISHKLYDYLVSKNDQLAGILRTMSDMKGREFFDEVVMNMAIKTGKQIDHPVYLNTSCAVACAFSVPEYNASYENIPCLTDKVKTRIAKYTSAIGLSDKYYEVVDTKKSAPFIRVSVPLEQEHQTFLRQQIGIEIVTLKDLKTTHEWRGNVSELSNGRYCKLSNCPEAQRDICKEFYNNTWKEA